MMIGRTAFLSKLLGLYCVIVGLSMAINAPLTVATVVALVHDAPLLFVFGLVVVGAGLAMVLAHNVWSGGVLPIVVTIVGWLTLIKGLLFLLLPPPAAVGIVIWGPAYARYFYLDAALAIILGIYLACGGYTLERQPQK